MIPYWLLFLLTAWLCLTNLRPVQGSTVRWSGAWHGIFWLLILMVGYRYEVGGDWWNYINQLNKLEGSDFSEAISQGDPAYSFVEWVGVASGWGVYFTNIACAALFSWGLVVFCRAQPRPLVALVVAVPYLITVVAMGYTRQGTAIGLAMIGLVALSDRKVLKFVIFVALAAAFHKSAVILMPLAILSGTKRKLWTMVWVAVASVVFYWLMLEQSVERLASGYLEAEYQSQGAGIRVAMNAVPAALFLLFKRKFVLSQADRTFWTWMSWLALVFVVLLVVSPSSTAVDRVALYWIPLQLFVLSRLPDAFGKQGRLNRSQVLGVVTYSGLVLFVWLFFAQTAFAWLPYQFYPLVWLLQ